MKTALAIGLAIGLGAAVAFAFDQDALTPIGSTPDELAAFLKSEIARYGDVIRKGNITPQ